MSTIDDDIAEQIEEATGEVCRHQAARESAWTLVATLKEQQKAATEAAKEVDEMFHHAARRLRRLREGREPDPERYPLMDRARPEIARNPAEAVVEGEGEGE